MTPGVTALNLQELDQADAAILRRLWTEARGTAPPKTFTARLMRLALAWDAQAADIDGGVAKTERAWKRIIRTRCKDRTIGSRVMRLFVELQLYQKFTRVAETEQRLTNHQGSGAATSQRDTTTSRY